MLQGESHGFGSGLLSEVKTSGLVLMAKSYVAYHELELQLLMGTVDREYEVLCHGFAACRRLAMPVFALKGARSRRSRVEPWARPSVSDLKVLTGLYRAGRAVSCAVLRIFTGRRHQIRTQLAHVGHAVCCDSFYLPRQTFLEDQAPKI